MNLTSRKLAACLGGLAAIVGVSALAAYTSGGVPEFDKVLLAITTLVLAAIGAQAIVDSKNGQGPGGPSNNGG